MSDAEPWLEYQQDSATGPWAEYGGKPAPVTAGDRAMAVPAGINAGIASVVGLPVATIANILDLAKAGAGVVQSKVTGNAPDPMFNPYDRAQVYGSPEWIMNKMNRVGINTEPPRPDDAASRYLHAAGGAIPAAMSGGEAELPALARQLASTEAGALTSQGVAEAGGGPTAQITAGLAVGGGTARAVSPRAPPLTPQKTPQNTQERGRAEGFVFKPSEVADKVGAAAEGLSGSPKLEVEASVRNSRVIDRLTKQRLGIPDKEKLTDETLEAAKKPYNAVYKELGDRVGQFHPTLDYQRALAAIAGKRGQSLAVKAEVKNLQNDYKPGVMDAHDVIQDVRSLRRAANRALRGPYNPDQEAIAHAKLEIADALETQLETHAQLKARIAKTFNAPGLSAQYQSLLDRFRAARVSLAQINTVQSAVVGNHVSAPKLARMKKAGVKLTDELRLIADMGDEFPNVTREVSKLKNKVPITVLEGATTITAAALTGNPWVLTGAAARPATRAALLSKLNQDRYGQQTHKPKPGPARAETLPYGVGAYYGNYGDQSP